ncbi:Chromo domain-containing protein [Gossypium australe]|uniref:Chromo domain-containing protein n=1 Tax=Gossypium australe TaxID=47621 RepID=A0A5B6WFC8_9ROSI|nr:Chromo domain-containing protein [Gossypium australe]
MVKNVELSPKFIRLYKIHKRVGLVTYQLEFPPELDQIMVRSDLSFEEETIQILDREVKVLRRKHILFVKILSWNHGTEEAT